MDVNRASVDAARAELARECEETGTEALGGLIADDVTFACEDNVCVGEWSPPTDPGFDWRQGLGDSDAP